MLPARPGARARPGAVPKKLIYIARLGVWEKQKIFDFLFSVSPCYNAAAGAVPVLFRPPFRNFVPTLDRCQTCRILLSASRCSCSSAHCRISVLTLMFSSCINSFAKSSRVIIIVSTPSFATTVA